MISEVKRYECRGSDGKAYVVVCLAPIKSARASGGATSMFEELTARHLNDGRPVNRWNGANFELTDKTLQFTVVRIL
jgi:hypothetical protein